MRGGNPNRVMQFPGRVMAGAQGMSNGTSWRCQLFCPFSVLHKKHPPNTYFHISKGAAIPRNVVLYKLYDVRFRLFVTETDTDSDTEWFRSIRTSQFPICVFEDFASNSRLPQPLLSELRLRRRIWKFNISIVEIPYKEWEMGHLALGTPK